MDEQNRQRDIILNWNIRNFITADKEPRFYQETLTPYDFLSQEQVHSFWSYPERLISMKQMLRWRDKGIDGNYDIDHDGYLKNYSVLERNARCIVSTIVDLLHRWASFNIHLENEKYIPVIEFADKYDTVLHQYHYHQKNMDEIDTDKLSDLCRDYKGIFDLIHEGDSVGEKNEARELLDSFLGDDSKLRENITIDDVKHFCWKLIGRITNYDFQLLKQMRLKDARSVIDEPGDDVQDMLDKFGGKTPQILYQRTIHVSKARSEGILDGIQQIADYACEQINEALSADDQNVQSLIDKLDATVTQLGIGKRKREAIEKDYLNGGRCVACLTFSNGTSVLAFSGFQDMPKYDRWNSASEDDRILVQKMRDAFKITKEGYAREFAEIAKTQRAILAPLSAPVMRNLVRYEVNQHCHLSKRGPFVREVEDHLSTGSDVLSEELSGYLKSAYSCCERKILASLAADPDIPRCRKAVLLVKFEPCLSCYGALQAWKTDQNVLLEVHYMYPYTK